MPMKCMFCEQEFEPSHDWEDITRYECPRCGIVMLTREAAEDFEGENFKRHEKRIMSIVLRNQHERRRWKPPPQSLTLDDLRRIVKQYRVLDPLDKMDDCLLKLERKQLYIGHEVKVKSKRDYPYYHCIYEDEMHSLNKLLSSEGLIEIQDLDGTVDITADGYKRLSELKTLGKDSRQCFVAMWFAQDMNDVYEKAIKPAIEYIEDRETAPRFRGIKIDNVEHLNDINDEIIAQIRRSRFMVCDLTGYRGGVYFEAGFAYGLGMPVIYTCRKDWVKPDKLCDEGGTVVDVLYDSNKNQIPIKKEGVHFDLEHMNRIEWEEDDLDSFRKKLTNRIKATIL